MKKTPIIAGVDEAGRGPLAGPVMAAAVILNPAKPIADLKDSKLLTEARRNALFDIICENALAWSINRAEVAEIDALNILRASLLAMRRAVLDLPIVPQHVLVDGNQCPDLPYSVEAVIRGDQLIAEISAASILAKVARDREMVMLDKQYPGYGFAKHKGYPTKDHVAALHALGASAIHRRSFAPVRETLASLETVDL